MSSYKVNELKICDLMCKIGSGDKEILKNISCLFPGGQLIGILGPSGSGKSTFLNCLSGYKCNKANATIFINNYASSFKELKEISCYVTQDIHLNGLLSVEENMMYAAAFKLGRNYSKSEKFQIIEEILVSFGLQESASTRSDKLSGGEKKRLAIAMEMISDPQIVFLDEPTTGLDIVATGQTMNYLRRLVDKGKMVVLTIHQVSASHFNMFDIVYVLGDGKCAYHGTPEEMLGFLDDLGLPCNVTYNPADFVIELCSGDYGEEHLSSMVKASKNGSLYLENHSHFVRKKCSFERAQQWNIQKTWFYTFLILMHREFIKTKRNLIWTPLRIVASSFNAVLIGILFWNVGNDATKALFNYNLIISVNANLLFTGFLFPILTFPMEMNVIKRETYNNYYSIGQYYLTVTLIDFPISVFCFVSSSSILYYMSGQPMELFRIALFLLVCTVVGILINGIGILIGSLFRLELALHVTSGSQAVVLLLSGFSIMFSHMPNLFRILSEYMYIRHSVVAMMISICGFNRQKLNCSEEELVCYYKDVSLFLRDIGIDANEYWNCIIYLLIWLLLTKSATYFTMRYKVSS